MPPAVERSRRKILPFLVATPFLVGCGIRPPAPRSPEPQKPKEQEATSLDGNIMQINGRMYLFSAGARYEVDEQYLIRSKFKEHGGVMLSGNIKDFNSFSEGRVQGSSFIDNYSGNIKMRYQSGGEVIEYSGGFLTADNRLNPTLDPTQNMFRYIQAELKRRSGFAEQHSYFFPYGRKMSRDGFLQGKYEARDTAKHPNITLKEGNEWGAENTQQNPKTRKIKIGHSLGSLVLLHNTMMAPDNTNHLILLAPPLRGIDGNGPLRALQIAGAKEAISKYLGQPEEVIDYLTVLWNDDEYKKQLDDFGERFVGRGGKIDIFISPDDGVVSVDSAYMKGATIHKISMGKDEPSGVSGHGKVLHFPDVVQMIPDLVGENRAA